MRSTRAPPEALRGLAGASHGVAQPRAFGACAGTSIWQCLSWTKRSEPGDDALCVGLGMGLLSVAGVCRGSGQWLVCSSSLKSWVLLALLAKVTSLHWGCERPCGKVMGDRSSRTCPLLLCLVVLLTSRQ